MSGFPLTRGQVRTLIRKAETAASLLRAPGHRVQRDGERKALAELLEQLAMVARRRLDPEWEPEPEQHHGGEDVGLDLFGGEA